MEIISYIKLHREDFQLNFGLLKPNKLSEQQLGKFGRQINIKKYGTEKLNIYPYYKKISRLK